MLEKALVGSKKYYLWLAFLGIIILVGFYFYLKQFAYGLGITGMSRSVSWGFYVAQFTYLVGVAASAVMVVLPYYLHNTILTLTKNVYISHILFQNFCYFHL